MRKNLALMSVLVMLFFVFGSVSGVFAQSPVETADFIRSCSVFVSGGSGSGEFDYYFTLPADAPAGITLSFHNDNSHTDWLVGHVSLTRVSDGYVISADSGFAGLDVNKNWSRYMFAGQYKVHFWPQGSNYTDITNISVSSCDIDAVSRSCPIVFEGHSPTYGEVESPVASGVLSLAGTDTYVDVYRYQVGSTGAVGHIDFGSLINYDIPYRAGNTRNSWLVHGADGMSLSVGGYGTNDPYYALVRVYDCGLPPTPTPTLMPTPTPTVSSGCPVLSYPASVMPLDVGTNGTASVYWNNGIPNEDIVLRVASSDGAVVNGVVVPAGGFVDILANVGSTYSNAVPVDSGVVCSAIGWYVNYTPATATATAQIQATATSQGTPPAPTPTLSGSGPPGPGNGWMLPTPMPMGEAYSFSNAGALEFLSFFVTFLHAMGIYWPIVISMMLVLVISIVSFYLKHLS